jgi:hypothetical protein
LVKVLFFVFLFGVLSFGRAFSIIHIEIYSLPIFVTEIVLLVSLFLIISKRKEWLGIPSLFLNAVFGYFLFGLFYLLWGFSSERLFALRDFIVLCGYVLFLPLAFICFNNLRSIKIFIFIILFADFIAILVGKMLIFGTYWLWFYGFVSKAKIFQVGIVYGICFAFLLVFYNYLKNKVFRAFILLLLSINLYMLFILGVRSIWLALVCLIIFLTLVPGVKVMFKVYFKLLISVIFIGSALFYINFSMFKSPYLDILIGRGKSFVNALSTWDTLVSGKATIRYPNDRAKLRDESERSGFNDIIWREKIWRQTIESASGNYLFGKGFGQHPIYDVEGYQKPASAFMDSKIIPMHNYFLTIFYKLGFLGLGLFLFINIYAFYYAMKYLKKCNLRFIKILLTGVLGALVFWHVTAMFFDVIDSPPTSIFLWIFIGLIFAIVRIDKGSEVEIK